MFCTNCGAKLSDGASYCTNCGAKVNAVVNDKKTSLSIERIRSFALSFMLFFPILLDTIGFHYKKATVSKKDISKLVKHKKIQEDEYTNWLTFETK